jgi:hypothetical protein
MPRCSKFLTLLLLSSPAIGFAKEVPKSDSPAFTAVPELSAGFDLLYEQIAEGGPSLRTSCGRRSCARCSFRSESRWAASMRFGMELLQR